MLLIPILWANLLTAQTIRVKDKTPPVFEFGAGISYVNFPHYPGASTSRTILLPFPTFIYRGDFLRSDENGSLRGRLVSNDYFEINTSFGFTFPSDQEDVPERKGMAELDTLLEVGPGFIFYFVPKSKIDKYSIAFRAAIRTSFSTDLSHTKDRGVVFSPRLYGWYKLSDKFTAFGSLTAEWTTQKYQDYYYSVGSQFATVNRPAFKANSGLLTQKVSLFLDYSITPKISVFGGMIYEDYKSSANRKSPLFVKEDSLASLVGLTWWFFESERRQKQDQFNLIKKLKEKKWIGSSKKN